MPNIYTGKLRATLAATGFAGSMARRPPREMPPQGNAVVARSFEGAGWCARRDAHGGSTRSARPEDDTVTPSVATGNLDPRSRDRDLESCLMTNSDYIFFHVGGSHE